MGERVSTEETALPTTATGKPGADPDGTREPHGWEGVHTMNKRFAVELRGPEVRNQCARCASFDVSTVELDCFCCSHCGEVCETKERDKAQYIDSARDYQGAYLFAMRTWLAYWEDASRMSFDSIGVRAI